MTYYRVTGSLSYHLYLDCPHLRLIGQEGLNEIRSHENLNGCGWCTTPKVTRERAAWTEEQRAMFNLEWSL